MKDLAEEYLLVCETDGYTVETIRQKRVLLNQFIRYCNQNEIEDVEEITSAFLRQWIIDEKKRCMIEKVDIYTLSKTVGHSKISTTQRYLESISDKKILERASKHSPLSM
jgi:site-specific recombinase XerD